MIPTIILACISYVFAGLFTYIRIVQGNGLRSFLLKVIASFSFVVLGIIVSFSQTTIVNIGYTFLIIGLLCAFLGDIFLGLRSTYIEHKKHYTMVGIVCFSLSHLGYFGFLVANSTSQRLLSMILLAIGISILVALFFMFFGKKILSLEFGQFKYISIAYSALLSMVVALGIILSIFENKFLFFAIGESLIFASDIILSTIYFGNNSSSSVASALNHCLYYLGQILIACSLMLF